MLAAAGEFALANDSTLARAGVGIMDDSGSILLLDVKFGS